MDRFSSRLFFAFGAVFFLVSIFVVEVGNAQWRVFDGFFGSPAQESSSGAIVPVATGMTARETEIVDTIKRVEPAVVSVTITKDLPKLELVPQNGGTFRRLRLEQSGTQRTEVGGGTAFFVSADGLLMTNKHVVSDEDADYTVLLNDGRTLTATVVGRDPLNDIALLQVDGDGFPFLHIADSDALELGQTAIAIGNSLGEFRNTVSVGVVSGLQRSIVASGLRGGMREELNEIIQTDAAINQGNSGGPLLSSRGDVIGMSTAVADVGQNIGFALPAKELRRVLENYEHNGRIVQPYIGVRYVPVTPALQEQLHLSHDYGVIVSAGDATGEPAVLPGSPAAEAGMQENDVILSVDGEELRDDLSLQRIVSTHTVGDRLSLRIVRGGAERTVTVTLAELQE